tara:strand:- start:369 stop:752 length:384 start_codon:yes stop_codon:yes gene_type:complete
MKITSTGDIVISDLEVLDWIAEYGYVSSYTFIVYGSIREDEVGLITQGLNLRVNFSNLGTKMMLFIDEIDEEQARAWESYQGTTMAFVFAGDMSDGEELITSTVSEALDFLRYKYDYLGSNGVESNV